MVVFVTPAFCEAPLVERCLRHVRETAGLEPDSHWILWNHYPRRTAQNKQRIQSISDDASLHYPHHVYDSGSDLGLHGSLNQWLEYVSNGDLMIGIDPDCVFSRHGWAKALVDVMQADDSLALAMLWNRDIDTQSQGAPERWGQIETIAGHRCLCPNKLFTWSMAAWRLDWVRQHGFRQGREFYGYMEHAMAPRLGGNRLVYLLDYAEGMTPIEPKYVDHAYNEWKRAHVSEVGFTGSFSDWLELMEPGCER